MTFTTAIQDTRGVPEVTAAWTASHRDEVRLIDVREPHELDGPLGSVDGAENIPLSRLLKDASLDTSGPLVFLCRSGRRSALAVRELRAHGVTEVASVQGGMLAWNTDVLGRTDIAADERTANARTLREAIHGTNGLPEVNAQWVADHLGRFRLIDVREPRELQSDGAILHAENLPLQSFLAAASQGRFESDEPLVILCRSGGRSGQVVQALVGAGFTNVASMEGGMFGWRARGLPVA